MFDRESLEGKEVMSGIESGSFDCQAIGLVSRLFAPLLMIRRLMWNTR